MFRSDPLKKMHERSEKKRISALHLHNYVGLGQTSKEDMWRQSTKLYLLKWWRQVGEHGFHGNNLNVCLDDRKKVSKLKLQIHLKLL